MKKIFTLFAFIAIVLSSSAQEMQLKDLSLTGMVKTQFSRMGRGYTSLDDATGNSLQIYNESASWAYGEYTVTAYLAAEEITLSGSGTWNLVNEVETLVATLTDDEQTVTYNITATVSAIKNYTLTCNDAQDFKPVSAEATTFVGQVEGVTLKITIDNMQTGTNQEVYGVYGETDIMAEKVSILGTTKKYTLSGTFNDAIGNTYKVSMKATPMAATSIEITDATYQEVDGDIVITGLWNDSELKVTINASSTTDSLVYEDATLEVGDILANSTAATFTQTEDGFTLTGEFIHVDETAIYSLNISGVKLVVVKDAQFTDMVKTQISLTDSSYTALDDTLGNSIKIYNASADWGYGEFAVSAYISADDITINGTGTWALVDELETLTATLTDGNNTVIYNITASSPLFKTSTITCEEAQYYQLLGTEATVFMGEVDGQLLKITIYNMVEGDNYKVLGTYGDMSLSAETVQVSSDNPLCTASGTFKDSIGNKYLVAINATPLQKTPIEVDNATYTEADGDIIITGIWNETIFYITLLASSTLDGVVYEDVSMELGDVRAASPLARFSKTNNAFTLTGEFILADETAIYSLNIWGTITTTAFENITTTDKAVKIIENGQLIIIRDGVKLNAQGQRF